MKIAIMMRAIDQDSAFCSYIEKLVEKMLEIDGENTYLLIYRTEKWFGRFARFSNAREILIKVLNKLLWDQLAVPFRCWKEGASAIYNPKFSVPVVSPCPVAMGLQEPGWWVWRQHYGQWNALYQRTMLPIYCRKARHFFPWSQFQLDENRRWLGLEFKNSTIVPPGPKESFHPISDSEVLENFRRKYDLPERIILSVTRVDHPGLEKSRSFHPGKNVDATVAAFVKIREFIPHRLVIAGRRVKEYLVHRGWSERDLEGICFIGFIPQDELPFLFNTADIFVMPSFYEGFGLTLLEAMACGCPAVVSSTGSCPEVSGGAALVADPHNPSDFADKIMFLLNSDSLREQLRRKSIERASCFSWERTARLTIEGLVSMVGSPGHEWAPSSIVSK